MKVLTLRRSDFQDPTAEVDYFNDYVLEPLGYLRNSLENIEEIDITVTESKAHSC